jgi:cytochrome c553
MNKLALSAMVASSMLFAVPGHAADAGAGKAKASDAGCTDCHGDNGMGDKENPALAGLAADKFTTAIQEFQSGKRTKNKMMVKAAKKLSAEDIANLAAYYASLKK